VNAQRAARTVGGRFRVWVSEGADCAGGRQDGPTFPTVAGAEGHAREQMKSAALNCIQVQDARRPAPPVRHWKRVAANWEEQPVATVVNVRVIPIAQAARVSAELGQRLAGQLEADLRVAAPGVLVISQLPAEQATRIIRDAIHGVQQTFALDPLDEGLNRVRISIG
jgi:hypothetical protein